MDRTVTSNKLTSYVAHFFLLLALFTSAAAHSTERITYYHNDNLGSPVAATDTQGNVIWRESYQPDGTRIQLQGDSQNKLWFTGKQEEATFGVSYFGARWYDSEMGRLLAMDPVGVSPSNSYSFNRYAYANNNPYRFVDHDGRDSDDLAVGGYWSGDDIGRLTGTDANIPDDVKAQTLEISLLMISQIADGAPGIASVCRKAFSGAPVVVVPRSAKTHFPENPNDLTEALGVEPTVSTTQHGSIRMTWEPNSDTRIRYESHPGDSGPFNARHHGEHYHVETKPSDLTWGQAKRRGEVQKIKPEDYQPGHGSGFLPGEPHPGM